MHKATAFFVVCAGLFALALLLPRSAAAWPDDPNVNAPLCTATGNQTRLTMVPDGEGGAIVTWVDYRSGTDCDIYAQKDSSDGSVMWAADGVALCTATGNQLYPTIVSDGAGGAIVTWHDYRSDTNYDIYAQKISSAGTVQWTADGVALCTATSQQYNPTIASDGAGGAIVTWFDSRSGNWDIYAQKISSAGTVQWTADGVALCSATGEQLFPTIVSDDAGGAIVTWNDQRSGDYDIYARKISSTGTAQWTADGVALCTATNNQNYPIITSDGAGGAIVTWYDYRSGANFDVYAQRISATGAVQWTPDGVALCTATGNQYYAMIVPDDEGGAIVAWQDQRDGNDDIYAPRVWADGSTPVLLSLVGADVGADGVKLTWLAGGIESGVATVYRSPVGGEWARIGEVTADGTGYLRYTDPIDATASRMGYRLGIVEAGIEGFYGETWVDLPAREDNVSFALEPVRPNPSQGGALTVRFTLPDAAAASLELLDVSGRRIATREVGSLGAGPHALDLGEGRHLAPGLYLVRLQQGANTRVTRAAVIE